MWNSRPSARLRRSSSTASPVTTIAASTNENGPNVLTTSSSAPIPATRCSKFSRRHVSTAPIAARRGSSERLASAIAGLDVVPELDLGLAGLPAEVDLATVAHRGEVDEPALEVAQHDLHRLQLAERALELQERLRHDASGRASAVGRSRLAERGARLLVGELLARGAQLLEPLRDPLERGIGLVDRVVARVLRHRSGSPFK